MHYIIGKQSRGVWESTGCSVSGAVEKRGSGLLGRFERLARFAVTCEIYYGQSANM